MQRPRLIVAGLSGGTGKTITSLGLTRSLVRNGDAIKPFKKGPDYIDAKWLSLAAQAPATNLDPYLVSNEVLRALFQTASNNFDASIIEGNRGLFDGKDLTGTCSTAELARILNAPVLLAMDCTKMTRTAAAIAAGMVNFEEGVTIAGIICNRTANDRHRAILRETIEHYAGVPVLGMMPKFRSNPIPERHMGLVSDQEYDGTPYNGTTDALDAVADIIEEHCDVQRIREILYAAPQVQPAGDVWDMMPTAMPESFCTTPSESAKRIAGNSTADAQLVAGQTSFREGSANAVSKTEPASVDQPARPRIGYVRDAALWFYYEENLQALEHAGAELVELSILSDDPWPALDGLYLGGGFPETLGPEIAANDAVRSHVNNLAEAGLPIYAECGGFMFLGRGVIYEGTEHAMAGVFPVRTEVCPRPQGLGYIDAEITAETPYHQKGSIVRGHEFHYSRCIVDEGASVTFGMKMARGHGMGAEQDGLVYKNVFASYTHLFALGEPHWAVNFVKAAREYRDKC